MNEWAPLVGVVIGAAIGFVGSIYSLRVSYRLELRRELRHAIGRYIQAVDEIALLLKHTPADQLRDRDAPLGPRALLSRLTEVNSRLILLPRPAAGVIAELTLTLHAWIGDPTNAERRNAYEAARRGFVVNIRRALGLERRTLWAIRVGLAIGLFSRGEPRS